VRSTQKKPNLQGKNTCNANRFPSPYVTTK
jgi:hypothetical protein